MPGQDRTGPTGEGPKSGRGLGQCPPRVGTKRKRPYDAAEELEAVRLEIEREKGTEDGAAGEEASRGHGRRRRRRRRHGGGRGGGRGFGRGGAC